MKCEDTSKRLKEAMDDIGITQQELSKRSGVSKASISQYVNGSHSPSNISAGKLGKVLGVNPVWLMGFDAEKIKRPTVADFFAGTDHVIEKLGLPEEYDLEPIVVETARKDADILMNERIMRFARMFSELKENDMQIVESMINALHDKRTED